MGFISDSFLNTTHSSGIQGKDSRTRETAPPSKRKTVRGEVNAQTLSISPRGLTWNHMDYAHEMKRRRLELLWKPWEIKGCFFFFFSIFCRFLLLHPRSPKCAPPPTIYIVLLLYLIKSMSRHP